MWAINMLMITWRHYSARSDLHLASIRLLLQRDPNRYSTPFMTEHDRVVESDDFKDGWTMSAYVKINPIRRNCEIKWVELRRIAADEDEEEDVDDEQVG